MGIQNIYKLSNINDFNNWSATIEDWGTLFALKIYTPSGNIDVDCQRETLRSAKITFTKYMEKKGAIWIKK